MQFKPKRLVNLSKFTFLIAFGLLLAGCGHLNEVTPISPSAVGERPTDFGLGPGVRPISSGPGDKSSPVWSPTGEGIAYVVDGYVAEKSINASESRRQTTRGFGAKSVAWISTDERLSILTTAPDESLYSAALNESLSVDKLVSETTSMIPMPESNALLVGLQPEPNKSSLALVGPDGKIQTYGNPIDGKITAISLVPGEERAIFAVQRSAAEPNFEILSYSFPEDRYRSLASLQTGLKVLGAPQWSKDGIYYVAGEEAMPGEGSSPDYNLYRLPPNSSAPELASGVGEDFVASSIKRNPNGDLLAIVGRRNPNSPANLYLLRPGVRDLVAVTANENMEIKTEAVNLEWSNDGRRAAIVARKILTEARIHDILTDELVSDFYNIYEVPMDKPIGESS